MKIISGGQTGVDRAALDVALKRGIPSGGSCPAGRLAEDGIIPERYPVHELGGGGATERTYANVRDSDATAIFYCGDPRGGTAETIGYCDALRRPRIIIHADTNVADAAAMLAQFVRDDSVAVLNVAGPRASEWPAGYDYVSGVLDRFLSGSTAA
jgi:hypothetical protein